MESAVRSRRQANSGQLLQTFLQFCNVAHLFSHHQLPSNQNTTRTQQLSLTVKKQKQTTPKTATQLRATARGGGVSLLPFAVSKTRSSCYYAFLLVMQCSTPLVITSGRQIATQRRRYKLSLTAKNKNKPTLKNGDSKKSGRDFNRQTPCRSRSRYVFPPNKHPPPTTGNNATACDGAKIR